MGVGTAEGRPVILKKLINHKRDTGEWDNVYDLADYERRWANGSPDVQRQSLYYLIHRVDMHRMPMQSIVGEEGSGLPAKLNVNRKCSDIDLETGRVSFDNGDSAEHDVVVGCDAVGSAVWTLMGMVQALGLEDYSVNSGIEYWGGKASTRSSCQLAKARKRQIGDLDANVFAHLRNSEGIRPWRVLVRELYPYRQKRKARVMGNAAHPMMPVKYSSNQESIPNKIQGACMAIEDTAALGIVFSCEHSRADVEVSLQLYEMVRKLRATRVQEAALQAGENIIERVGFSSSTTHKKYQVADGKKKLPLEEMNMSVGSARSLRLSLTVQWV
ncbi:hypothetical protein BAUCODRAFT_132167 [Baudoinia panamericana UAMH 10762]|uniref:FAD-binding domain-containing protein n=1 Tax=Baudoinia panamericana (strain UAMH 10762) TaxID=717646 RepID=M2LM44_BAUPA|nr:uncharacterized protein BAUCODRAFT_132167 [Baudoinia panamericana UAMH 10762]EMC95392.1 hypothetical protein BAUCODRAFT_132167 [Baudoinia panamericana UAMH 10762]